LHKETSLVASRMTWGLIPSWVKDRNQANEIRNKTLNARGESIFEKPAFQSSIREKRCLFFVDGFYEYYHFKRKTFPHFIQLIDETQPLIFGGIGMSGWIKTRLKLFGQLRLSPQKRTRLCVKFIIIQKQMAHECLDFGAY
jgi:putative SOS response-associated peptidase YedK